MRLWALIKSTVLRLFIEFVERVTFAIMFYLCADTPENGKLNVTTNLLFDERLLSIETLKNTM